MPAETLQEQDRIHHRLIDASHLIDINRISSGQFVALSVARRLALVRGSRGQRGASRQWLLRIVMLGSPRTCVPGVLAYALGLGYVGMPLSALTITQAILCFLGGFVANLQNICTDIEEDCRNLPGRMYILACVGRARLLKAIGALQLAMLAAAAALSIYNLLFMVVALAVAHQYSFRPLRAKGRPLAGLLVFACMVTYPYFVGLLADPDFALARQVGGLIAGDAGDQRQAMRFLCMGMLVTLWFVAKGLFKNVPDYHGDRAAGVRTSATLCRSWCAAALTAAVFTVLTYLSFALPVMAGLEPPRLLLALIVLPLATWNCVRLVRADDGARGNVCLYTDMVISVGFLGALLLLVHPTIASVAALTGGALVVALSDWLQVDSRRAVDAPSGPR